MDMNEQSKDIQGSRLLQREADRLCGGVRDRPVITLTDQAIWCQWRAWSPALTRFETTMGYPLPNAAQISGSGQTQSRARAAVAMMRSFLRQDIATQHIRHASAKALGLIGADGSYSDLEPDRILIDRTMLRMLDEEGYGIRGMARLISENDSRLIYSGLDQMVMLDQQDRDISILHDVIGPPVICTCQPIGSSWYRGDELTVPGTLPNHFVVVAAGMRLGDLIETGHPSIDCRLIKSMVLGRSMPWDPSSEPTITVLLESDNIAFREADRALT